MGADIGFNVNQKKMFNNNCDNTYFRDNYNSYGLFAVLSHNKIASISWWQMRDNKDWFEKDESIMTKKGITEFFDILKSAKKKLAKKQTLNIHQFNSKDVKEKAKPYKEHLDWLIFCVEECIKQNGTCYWSV